MKIFTRREKRPERLREPVGAPESHMAVPHEIRGGAVSAEIRVSRTLVKSEPELVEVVSREPRLRDERIEVTLTEKGFGTCVVIAADAGSGLEEADLEMFLDQLAEPQKRPFSNA
jgi:hypothetical protein